MNNGNNNDFLHYVSRDCLLDSMVIGPLLNLLKILLLGLWMVSISRSGGKEKLFENDNGVE